MFGDFEHGALAICRPEIATVTSMLESVSDLQTISGRRRTIKTYFNCLRVRGVLKWGIFTGCASKIRITLIQK